MAMSAADLQVRSASRRVPVRRGPSAHLFFVQRRHELEGAPDPFPSLLQDSPARPKRNGSAVPAQLDTESEQAFPSLAPSAAPVKRAGSAWGAGAPVPRIQAPQPVVQKQNLATDSFTLAAIDLSAAGKDNRPATLADVMKHVMFRFNKVHIEASSNQRIRQTTFHLKSESPKELEKAKRLLIAQLSPKVTLFSTIRIYLLIIDRFLLF